MRYFETFLKLSAISKYHLLFTQCTLTRHLVLKLDKFLIGTYLHFHGIWKTWNLFLEIFQSSIKFSILSDIF